MRQCLKDKIVIDKVGNFIIAHRKGNMEAAGVVKRREGEPEDQEIATILAISRCFDRFGYVKIEIKRVIRDILENPHDYILVTNEDKRMKLYKKHVLQSEDYDNDNAIFFKRTKKYIFIEDLIFKHK